jgi:4-carboxymuconolactone decarboxylase
MTRIATARNAFVRLADRSVRRKYGRPVDTVGVYGHAPSLLLGYGALEQATARQRRVDAHLKALAEVRVASLSHCEFCIDIASHLAREAGASEAQLLALPDYRTSSEFSVVERLVLDYATAMTRTPVDVGDELFAALAEHFDDAQLVELTIVIALENMRSRFNRALDITPGGFSEGMVCAVPEVAA